MATIAIAEILSIETLRSASTVLAFAAFIAVFLWAYSRKRHDDFEQAANLPFADEPVHRTADSDFSREMKSLHEDKNP